MELLIEKICQEEIYVGEDSMLWRVHPKKRSVSWVNSVSRQFLPNGSLSIILISSILYRECSVTDFPDRKRRIQILGKSKI